MTSPAHMSGQEFTEAAFEAGRAVPETLEAVSVLIDTRNADAAVGRTFEGIDVILPISEDSLDRPAAPGQRVLALVVDPTPGAVIVSRTHPLLPERVLEGIVPEVSSGQVRVMGVSRDPGHRTKIAVAATTEGVDPVAACVGRGGKRVSKVVAMLGGERVEIIAWHPDKSAYLAAALAPGKVNRVKIRKDGEAIVWTDHHMMAATVGEQGQNSLLAGRLVGVRVHVEVGDPSLHEDDNNAPS